MEPSKLKILFLCTHNSARSQMAEAWLNHLCPHVATAQSAGIEPGVLNPLAVSVMAEAGVDISQAKTKSVQDFLRSGESFSRIIAVCSQNEADRCPMFPGMGPRLNWTFKDPSKFEGTDEQKLANMRKTRDDIRAAIENWCSVAAAARAFMK